jgi:hypothetical protein
MTNRKLSTYVNLHRRYFRSVNLERDLDIPDAVLGYVPTERSIDALRRIITAFNRPNAHRYWTMTGVYGTGKSAFAHFGNVSESFSISTITQAVETAAGVAKPAYAG